MPDIDFTSEQFNDGLKKLLSFTNGSSTKTDIVNYIRKVSFERVTKMVGTDGFSPEVLVALTTVLNEIVTAIENDTYKD